MSERNRGIYTGDLEFDVEDDDELGLDQLPRSKSIHGEIEGGEPLDTLDEDEDDVENEALRRS